jgi:hypothetical protein
MKSFRTLRWAAVAPIVIASSIGLLTAARPQKPRPLCEIAHSWVMDHSGKLPTSLDEFVTYPKAYRRAIYTALPVEARVHLWQEFLTPFLANSSPLTAKQRALVQFEYDNLGRYQQDATGRTAVAQDSLYQKFSAEFPKSQTALLLNFINQVDERDAYPAGVALPRSISQGGPNAAPEEDCNCGDGPGPLDCDPGQSECHQANDCIIRIIGCGILGMMQCDGTCQ